MDTGTKDHPKDCFSNPLEEGETVAFISHGQILRGSVLVFTPKGVRVALSDGSPSRIVLRDRVVGPRSLEEVII